MVFGPFKEKAYTFYGILEGTPIQVGGLTGTSGQGAENSLCYLRATLVTVNLKGWAQAEVRRMMMSCQPLVTCTAAFDKLRQPILLGQDILLFQGIATPKDI
ncbi:hypothetical protein L0F63_002633, partial [Massospora cicadina]